MRHTPARRLDARVIRAAASAGAGLLVIAVLGLAGIGLFQAVPLLGQKWEDKLLAMRKAEARANPIEQRQNFLLEKKRAASRSSGGRWRGSARCRRSTPGSR